MSRIRGSNEISNSDNILDTRDIQSRIEYLEEMKASEGDVPEGNALDEDEEEELRILLELREEVNGIADWYGGEALINESYWEDYCQELVSDIGDLLKNLPSYLVIDWEATANNLAQDYSTVDFNGTSFYVRDY